MRIYDLLNLLSGSVYISVFINESCGLDEWSVHIYEGYADEFICTIYDLKNKYHLVEAYFISSRTLAIYLEED